MDIEVKRGYPDPAKISTSYVERQNLTMRMGMRRCTRLTNAFSKKVENFTHAVSLHYMHYNFARPHSTLANPYRVHPRWPLAWRITSGRCKRSRGCSTSPARSTIGAGVSEHKPLQLQAKPYTIRTKQAEGW
jgi:hypothetical protein